MCLPKGMPLAELVADAAAGLAEQFADVQTIHAESNDHVVHLVHTATAPDGEGIVIETRLDNRYVSTWVSPTHRYLTDRGPARTAMAGRTAGFPVVPASDGIGVAEAWLELDSAVAAIRRRGGEGQYIRRGSTEAVPVPASTLPALLAAEVGLGPRPSPARRELVVGPHPDLPNERWRLHWAVGRDDVVEPADEEWSTARLTATGTLEIIDRGPQYPLMRVLDRRDLPGLLADDAQDADPQGEYVGLVPITSAEVFALLAAFAGN